jgi:hypothetical protein
MSAKAAGPGPDLSIVAGSTRTDWVFKISHAGGNDITGSRVVMNIGYVFDPSRGVDDVRLTKDTIDAAEAVFVNASEGTVRFIMGSNDTRGASAPLTVGTYFYDVWLEISGDWYAATTPGKLTVVGGVGLD